MYVCFSTKAVYFDLVSDLSTEAFIASLYRFVSIYGIPHDIYTDNGSNFIGANRELQKLFDLLRSDSTQEQLHHWASVKGIIWHFSPGRAKQ